MAVKRSRVVAGGLIFALICITSSWADDGEAYYGFLEEPINSRVMGMGSAGTSLGSAGFSFYNPASPAFYRPAVSLDFGRLYEDLPRGHLEIGYHFEKWFLGGALQNQSIEFQFSNEQGIVEGVKGSEQGTM